ncbi:aminotransferase class I/II-fold pyridoxal phosphate-dependent enzyme [Geochorda subterranea]|uniref:Aminotransferase class I/II-fold pyridoxal phosphate-dependent enzyme n=1 Tax=Geochorda subterranea TaxID=3109564 RepID=A0ABZ1BKX9_9FIRM|nr:aminotransferase class I/II-fold pyridoxal phosphate-dependent enzyme [Limnochorda sp. LNt]WRP13263.1 aminotransferase class I/II-fold pyridoxal phosphate-dependent enzyme [Limnochorda sp. LNt]
MSEPSFIAQAFPEIDPRAERVVLAAIRRLQQPAPPGVAGWAAVEEVAAHNTARVLAAFHQVGASEGFLAETTGYAYGDPGREALEQAWALVMGAEAALVRPQLVSGTHALTCALFGVLRPGDELVVATGLPYDTLWPVLGIEGQQAPGSLAEWGVRTRVVPLTQTGEVDLEALEASIGSRTRMVLVQRSRGYAWRPSLSIDAIAAVCEVAHRRGGCVVLVDNAYGEFVETREPCHVGADLVAGSLIKNPGGTLAPSGGYVAGSAELVAAAAARLTAPGLAAEVGPALGVSRWIWMGLFLAPRTVAEAVAGAMVAAAAFSAAGFAVSPTAEEPRTDTVQVVRAGRREAAMAIVRGIQRASALDARARPHPARLPGYRDPIVMAGGTFVQGSSSELSADLPLRPPYDVFLQGGVSRHHVALGVARALHELWSDGLLMDFAEP